MKRNGINDFLYEETRKHLTNNGDNPDEKAAFEVLNLISSAEYGKQRFFKEKKGVICDRKKMEYLLNFETALNRYVEEISNAE